jgi:hypothetical protein
MAGLTSTLMPDSATDDRNVVHAKSDADMTAFLEKPFQRDMRQVDQHIHTCVALTQKLLEQKSRKVDLTAARVDIAHFLRDKKQSMQDQLRKVQADNKDTLDESKKLLGESSPPDHKALADNVTETENSLDTAVEQAIETFDKLDISDAGSVSDLETMRNQITDAVQAIVKEELAKARNARLDLIKFNRKVLRDADRQASASVNVVPNRLPPGLVAFRASFERGEIESTKPSTQLDDVLDGTGLVCLEGEVTEMVHKLKTSIPVKNHTKWMTEMLNKDANRSSVLSEYKTETLQFLDKEIRAWMSGNGWERVFARGVRVDANEFRSIWSMQHWMADAHHVTCTVSPMGLADCRLLLNGEEFVLGFPIASVPGIDLKGKIAGLQAMDGDALAGLVKRCVRSAAHAQ